MFDYVAITSNGIDDIKCKVIYMLQYARTVCVVCITFLH